MNPVLIVEDDPDTREALADLLRQEGFKVDTAPHGRAALDRLHAPGAPLPRIILLDLMMPVMSGWEFREAQLREPGLAPIPVVVMSAASMDGMEKVGDDFVGKPFDLQGLLKTIQRHVH